MSKVPSPQPQTTIPSTPAKPISSLSTTPPPQEQSQAESQNTLSQLWTLTTDIQRSSNIATDIVEGDASNTGQLKALLEHAKDIVVRLRQVVATEVEFGELRDQNGRLPTYEQLVDRLSSAFRHQRAVNQMSAKLISLNYIANMNNFAKNRQLQKAIARGRKQILELQDNVTSLEESVDDLTTEVDVQKANAERLKLSLDSTRVLLETTMTEYRTEMSRQRDVLKKQQGLIGDLWKSKFNQDFFLDALLGLFSLWTVNTMIVEYPIAAVLNISMHPSRRRLWARQFSKFIMFLLVYRKVKLGAASYGLHNGIGAAKPYITSTFGALYTALTTRLLPRPPLPPAITDTPDT
ncbi:hypothetical protein HK097_000545 [Rhizophlyctis rosea]|uniref:Uncharacterized protein n=1 Tax=Rhizophlyctis rosea TaxID=64517 RepID=A0AAD5SJZ1_9FUNG|nr:hypothetical protein HK097_000545 [Rhizophlyctis rosea]